MAINASVIKSSTTLGTTGGSDLTLAEIGSAKLGSARFAPTVDTTEVSRRTFEFSSTAAPVAPGSATGYGKARRKITFKIPRDVGGGVYEPAVYDLYTSEPVTTSAADQLEARKLLAQLLFDSDYTGFFDLGGLS
jgi:hypothetical protein